MIVVSLRWLGLRVSFRKAPHSWRTDVTSSRVERKQIRACCTPRSSWWCVSLKSLKNILRKHVPERTVEIRRKYSVLFSCPWSPFFPQCFFISWPRVGLFAEYPEAVLLVYFSLLLLGLLALVSCLLLSFSISFSSSVKLSSILRDFCFQVVERNHDYSFSCLIYFY